MLTSWYIVDRTLGIVPFLN